MLELIVAASMMAAVMTSLSLVMRSTRQCWETLDTEYAATHQMHAVTRHFVRAAREAKTVTSIKPDGSGITMTLADDSPISWEWRNSYHGNKHVVLLTTTAGSSVLAHGIDALAFRGFGTDGVTQISEPDDIQVVEVTATVTIPRSHVAQRSAVGKVFIRLW
ncbi:MAG: hypothetical protein KDB00_06155 [Planctomycetales bacterium]|nr:hypothetical protein [Planctomycetales bacterium]